MCQMYVYNDIGVVSPGSINVPFQTLTKQVVSFSDMDETELPLPASDAQALNYSVSGVASARGEVGTPPPPALDPALSSTETLLRNIQGLLKVAADNARQQERQISYEKGTNSNMIYLLSLAQYYMYLAATHSR